MGKRLVKRQRHPGWHLAIAGLLLAGATAFLLYVPSPERTSDQPIIAPAPAPIPYQAADARPTSRYALRWHRQCLG